MSSPFANGMRPRALAVAVGLTVWFVLILGRQVQLQVFGHARAKAEVLGQSQNEIAVYPERGTITDRNGKILARSLPVESVYYSPSRTETPARQMEQIARLRGLLDLAEKDMARIGARVAKRSGYILIKRKIDPEIAAKAMGLGIINAEVPLAEMFGYATALRSLSQGRAVYTMQFAHYSEVPQGILEEIVKK